MKCLFCSNKLCDKFNGFDCNRCKTYYYYEGSDINKEIVIWQFFFKYRNKYFVCRWDKDVNKTVLHEQGHSECLITINGSSILTPNNIMAKMPFILTFL